MSPGPGLSGVVVGFDGSGTSRQALDWGAATAAAYGAPLTLLRARPDAEGDLVEVPIDVQGEPRVAAGVALPDAITDVIDAALSQIHAGHPDLEVHALLHPDAPVEALLEASRTADVVVIGSRGLEGFRGLLLGSTTMNVAPHAYGTVVVVHPPTELTVEAARDARHPDEVVVGYDGSEHADHALDFALEHAALTGLGVAVITVTKSRRATEPAAVPDDFDDEAVARVRERLPADAARYPGVAVTVLHGTGRPAGVLVEQAHGAPLAAVGARGRGGFAGLVMGSVGLQMLMHAECPVAVVHAPAESD